MSSFNKNTSHDSNYKIKVVTLDSKDAFTSLTGAEDCTWTNYLPEPLKITRTTEIYLESIYIGGYKINACDTSITGDHRYAWNKTAIPAASGTDRDGHVYYFCLDIPQFEIKNGAAEHSNQPYNASGVVSDMSGYMHNRFCLCQEPALVGSTVPADITELSPFKVEYKPFILGHLSKTSVFVSKIEPKIIDKIKINITDQDGRTIWTIRGEGAAGNPCDRSRRIFMQFLFVEKRN